MYTYLVASLPTLVLGEAPPFRGEEFLFRLQGVLDEEERAQAAAILEGRPVSGSPFADAWQARETQLRNAVARARAAARTLELRGSMRPHEGFDVGIAQMVTDAFGRSDPLERELELDRCRWHTADDLARSEIFGLAPVLAFAAKLRIAERWSAMTDEAGRERVEAWIRRHSGAADADTPASTEGVHP